MQQSRLGQCLITSQPHSAMLQSCGELNECVDASPCVALSWLSGVKHRTASEEREKERCNAFVA